MWPYMRLRRSYSTASDSLPASQRRNSIITPLSAPDAMISSE